jgi:type II secretory pathway pseudopilin PulG
MVTIILGILAAVAIPRYLTSITKAEEAAEDAVISSITAGLESYATEQMMANGRRSWPTDPWEGLQTKPTGYANANENADSDGEWRFNVGTANITHQRGDNTVHHWDYDRGQQDGASAAPGSMGAREAGVGG